jgi:hypothetical protein
VKSVPVSVTPVPPAVLPEPGLTPVTAGTGAAVYVNWSAAAAGDVPLGVVTVTSTVPAAWGGAVAVIDVAELTVNERAAVLPKLTAVAPVKFVPVIVTEVPPAVLPVVGLSPVTAGTGVLR